MNYEKKITKMEELKIYEKHGLLWAVIGGDWWQLSNDCHKAYRRGKMIIQSTTWGWIEEKI